MRMPSLLVLLIAVPTPAFAQVTTTNPLDELKARVEQLLQEAGLPFTESQRSQLALEMEEQRRASERLFGDAMDFSRGAVRGADRDRALAGIQWMNEAFAATLEEILTPGQNRVWAESRRADVLADGGLPALRLVLDEAEAPLDDAQDEQATDIYERAAARLRQTEASGEAGTRPEAIREEALAEVARLLTDEQVRAVVPAAEPADSVLGALRKIAPPSVDFVAAGTSVASASSAQIAQIRINNNAFTTESYGGRGAPGFGGGGRVGGGGGRGGGGGGQSGGGGRGGSGSIEVIERGGVGDYHGNFSFDFRDEAMTATNALADNKPEFQQRNINANISGPFIRNLLTASLTFNQNEQENGSTVIAEMPAGALSLGVTSPTVSRQYGATGQMQVNDRHALHFRVNYGTRDSRNNGIGGFTLPERAFSRANGDLGLGLREIWAVSPNVIHEAVFIYSGEDDVTNSATDTVGIDVLDAFEGGSAGRKSAQTNRNYHFSNLFWREGPRVTFKAGAEITHERSSSVSQDDFAGLFTFSSLADYEAGRPLTYRVTQGDPFLEVDQTEVGAFVQADWHVNRRFTLFTGLRYGRQSMVDDSDNVDPRLGFAYSLGASTIVRGGAGLFHQDVDLFLIEEVVRVDGARQHEVIISNPAYPDPFRGGTAAVVPPSSRRVFAPGLDVPYDVRGSLSIERTLPWNIGVDVAYDYQRGVSQLRTRDVNAPLPGEGGRPDPGEGAILQLESTARSRSHSVRLSFRQRLSFLNYQASYTLSSARDDGDGSFSRPMNNYDPALDRGRSRFDERHRYNFTANWEAPFGTLLTVRGFGASGAPYTITTGEDDNHDQNTNDRPPGVARNSQTGPGFFNIDMTLTKTFRLQGASGAEISVYANVRNAFNLENLRNPSGVLTSSRFGIPTAAAPGRDVELGMQYQF